MGELRKREDKSKNVIFFGVKMDGDDQHSIEISWLMSCIWLLHLIQLCNWELLVLADWLQYWINSIPKFLHGLLFVPRKNCANQPMRTSKQTFSSSQIIPHLKELNSTTYVLNFAGVKLQANQTLLLGIAKLLLAVHCTLPHQLHQLRHDVMN